MKLQRSQNTKRNIIAGEADKIAGIILPFIVRTMIIHQMGASYLGLTGLFYSIIQMLNLAEMGFGMAITFSMYGPIAQDDTATINALLRFYSRVYRIVGLTIAVFGLLVLWFLPYLTRNEAPQDINIYLLYLIYLGDACLNCVLFPEKKALLAAHQRADVSSGIHFFTQAGMYILQMFSICLARNFYLYALTVPISTAAYSLWCSAQSDRLFPAYHKDGKLERDVYLEIRKQVIGLMIRKVASLSRNAFDSMFISACLGLEINAIYGNYYYVMDAVIMLLAVVKNSMAGGVGNSIAMETVQKNRKDMDTINFLFMVISGWCAVCMLCLYQPFMALWTDGKMMLPGGYAVVFSLYFYVLKMSDIRTLYSESVGLWWQARYLSMAEALTNLFLNWLLIRKMGLLGIILATLISYFVFNFIGGALVLFRGYFTEDGIRGYFLGHVKYFLVTVAVATVTCAVTSQIPFSGIAVLVTDGVLCIVIPVFLYGMIYKNTAELKAARPLLRTVVKR